jgi:diadenosine tetraphosphate (Ap4A) HIT family hydrolase
MKMKVKQLNLKLDFVLLPHYNWTQETIEHLHCLAFTRRQDILTIRDLSDKEIPLLKKINEKATKAIQEYFGVYECNLRAYIHYIPSIFQFHVHFVHSKCCGGTTTVKNFEIKKRLEGQIY